MNDNNIEAKQKPRHNPAEKKMLVRYGKTGTVGWFTHEEKNMPKAHSRVMIKTERGLEIGEVVGRFCYKAGTFKKTEEAVVDYYGQGVENCPITMGGKFVRYATEQDLADERHVNSGAKEELDKCRQFIKELNSHGYAVIVQDYVPWEGDIASGNILILEKHILLELMGEGPLIWLNRDGAIEERIKFKKDNLKEVDHFGKRLIQKEDLLKLLKTVKDIPIYKIIEFTLRPEGLYFWQIRDDKTAREIEDKNLLALNFNRFMKINSMREIQKYQLPMSETIFVFDFAKQEKEIQDFIQDKDYVAIRTDKRNGLDFYPHNLRCPKNKAKKLIKELNLKGYAVIIHEQKHIPFGKAEHQVSGNILILKEFYLIELMEGEPLYLLTRDGKIDEFVKVDKDTLKEVMHSGKRIIKKSDLDKTLKLIRRLPDFKIAEFTLRKDGLIFWQIIDDKTAKMLEE